MDKGCSSLAVAIKRVSDGCSRRAANRFALLAAVQLVWLGMDSHQNWGCSDWAMLQGRNIEAKKGEFKAWERGLNPAPSCVGAG